MGLSHSKSDGTSSHTCPVQSLDENATAPAVGSMTFYQFNKILAGACAIFALVVMLFIMFMHATHLSKPNEQLKILRIAFLLPFYAIISYICILAPTADVYLVPWLDFVQSISLGTFFLLICEFVVPEGHSRNAWFSEFSFPDKKSPTGKGDGLRWFRRSWISVFQFPVVALLAAIFTDITQAAGVYCQFKSEPYYAKLWISIVSKISLLVVINSILMFCHRLKTQLAGRRPYAKLFAFKIIVLFTFLQSIVFMILQSSTSALQPTASMTYADLNIGIPNLITCVILVPLSLFFFYAYPWAPYLLRRQRFDHQQAAVETGYTPQAQSQSQQYSPSSYQGGPLGISAWLGMLNPSDILQAISLALRMLTGGRDSRDGDVDEAGVSLVSNQRYIPLKRREEQRMGAESYQSYQMR